MKARFMEIVFLTKVEKSNINASGTEGNITTLKKTTEIDDTQRVFISGASIKYSIKEYLADLGFPLSPVISKAAEDVESGTKASQITTKCDPQNYIDDDLFGYMNTATAQKRVAPIKTNGMISLFPYTNDLNRGVRFDPKGQNHSLYDIEIVTTIFRSNWAVELDRIGREGDKDIISNEEKEKRIKAFIESIFNLWSRVKQTNYLTDISPQVITIVFRDDKTLTIGDKLRIDANYNLDIDALLEAIKRHKNRIKEFYIGYSRTFINNEEESKDAIKGLDEDIKAKVKVMDIVELKSEVLKNEFNLFT
ncbi:MAG: type I-B CRISPR-associated protein Cas7/Cst2/DevR [Candidatus Nitrosocaldaceae archaeon]|nr:MAG: type I-B CRISPR-associated protein Cas7/Cst2/DevR [Candidatus Nitrosocaldaceae archaeon]